MAHPFHELSSENQERAKAMFFDARHSDGYWYELDLDGKVLCRNKICDNLCLDYKGTKLTG